MTPNEAFEKVYHGKPNIMTPDVMRRWTQGSYHVELSQGTFMSHNIWGITFVTLDGDRVVEHSAGGFHSRQEALDYADEVTSETPNPS